jgi:ABC1 atypical kinase-like domain
MLFSDCHSSFILTSARLCAEAVQCKLTPICASPVATLPLQCAHKWLQVLTRASEAYGRMILETGLFQADGHPGNILVMKGGKVGLIDYGQSKQLTERDRFLIAKLIIALNTCVPSQLCRPGVSNLSL